MSPNVPPEDDPLQSLIEEILESEARGDTLDRDALLEQHPQWAASLRDFFANHDRMKSHAGGDAPTLPPNSVDGDDDPTLAPRGTPKDHATLPPNASGAPTDTAVGQTVRYFGDYELVEEIARGGMGVVFKANQLNLNRTVALKMILAGQFAGDEDVQRFHTEAEAAAKLDHPGIVPIFEIGEHDGQHYFSMAYVDGQSLADRVSDGPLPPHEAAELVHKICQAIDYAHQRGVIHRDLKPANILLDASGQPKVTDFGLAKKTEADSGLTGTGQILGTPAFMPPEQAAGKTDEVGPLADVYSLGAILYCLLSGRPPFQAASPMDTLLQVLEQQPIPPRTLNPQVPQELNTICLKCLEKESSLRYSSATELAEDLERYLNSEPIAAKPPSLHRLVRYWVGQNVGAIGWAVVIGTLLGLFFAASTLHTDLMYYLRGIGDNLEKLQISRESQPLLVRLPQTPAWFHGILRVSCIVLLVTAGLLVAAFVRPKNRPSDVIAGTLAGFCAAAALFLVCFSWLFAYREMARANQELIVATRAKENPSDPVPEGLMRLYPGLREAAAEDRGIAALNLVEYRQIVSAAVGVFHGFWLSMVICIPSCLLETMLAGSLMRRHQSVRSAIIPYLEIGLPVGMICANLIMHHILAYAGFVKTFVPLHVTLALYIPLVAATIAAVRRVAWPWRVLLHTLWIASIVAMMSGALGKVDPANREQPVLGVGAKEFPDRCEIRVVVPGSPASRAGLLEGDVITSFDGIDVTSFPQLQKLIGAKAMGDTVVVEYSRDGTTASVPVELGRRPPPRQGSP